ncbi:MAG: hypothetical protein ACM3N0_09475 [Chloroflexota bacterium]
MSDRRKALAWEARWALPTAIATFAAVALLIAWFILIGSYGGGGEAEGLREIHSHAGAITFASVLQALGFALLAAPLAYIFQAALLRSDRMRSQFRALVIAAPLALAVAALLSTASAKNAAFDFTAGKVQATLSVKEAASECRSERKEDAKGFREEFGKGGAAVPACVKEKREDDAASNALKDASLRKPADVLQAAGVIALIFALVYCSLNAMRTGLLTRFWGSLGIALGVATLFGLFQVDLIWFVYIGLLAAGWLPGGRPPAWAAGEAIPWPTAAEKAAAELEPPDGSDPDGGDPDGSDPDGSDPDGGELDDGEEDGTEARD